MVGRQLRARDALRREPDVFAYDDDALHLDQVIIAALLRGLLLNCL